MKHATNQLARLLQDAARTIQSMGMYVDSGWPQKAAELAVPWKTFSLRIEPSLGFSRVDGQVSVVMTPEDWEQLTLALMAFAGMLADRQGQAAANKVLALSNRLNAGNPDWRDWNV